MECFRDLARELPTSQSTTDGEPDLSSGDVVRPRVPVSQPRHPSLLLGLILSGCAVTGCGSSDDIVVEVEPPLQAARISSYTGWFPGPWHQEAWIRLAEGVELGAVVDLSAFGGLRPGMGIAEATAALGPPAGERRDYRGDEWTYWATPKGWVELSCRQDCSGSNCGDPYWDLRARPEDLSASALFHPSVVAVVSVGEHSKPEVEYRAVHAGLSDYQETVELVTVSRWGRYLRWSTRGRTLCARPSER